MQIYKIKNIKTVKRELLNLDLVTLFLGFAPFYLEIISFVGFNI